MLLYLGIAEFLITFAGGVLVGYGASKAKEARKIVDVSKEECVRVNGRRSSTIVFEAVKKLESEGKIKLHLSPADNAVQMLESILPGTLDWNARSSIAYAINVLKSDFTLATVPVGLSVDSNGTPRDRQFSIGSTASEVVVLDWLVSNYTRKTSTQSVQGNAFRSCNKKVKIAVKFRGNFSHRDDEDIHGNYVYDVEPEEMEAINAALENVDDWDWDVWKLHAVTKGRPLQTLGWHLLHKWDLINVLKLDQNVVRNWLKLVERMYLEAEYHTSTHAADVLQATHHFLAKGGLSEYLNTTRVFSLLIAAMMHDVGHDGKNNLYHENAMTERALMFNDQSIQENFHCMTFFSSMTADSQINILAALKPDQAKEVRRLIILATLGTDMKMHYKHFQKLKSLINLKEGCSRDDWLADSDASDDLCSNILHAADTSNPCRDFEIAWQWAGRVLNEFFVQGDAEEQMGLPISPLCSRNTTLIPASQIGFISFVVLPYFQALAELFPKLTDVARLAEENLQRWRAVEAEESRAAAANGGHAHGNAMLSRTPSGAILKRRPDVPIREI